MNRIHAHFDLQSLTGSQLALLDALESFFKSDAHVFLLLGAAGTGKTYMTRGIASWLKQLQEEEQLQNPPASYSLMAFTGRAALILRQKTGFATSTIHSFVYRKLAQVEDVELNVDNSEALVVRFGIQDSASLALDHCSIVDEASMFPSAKHEQELIKFGTGYLLADWVQRTEIGRKTNSRKAIFVGDPAQLPPVNESKSHAQDPGFLEQMFGLKCTSFTLKEVVRQASDSNIIRQANHVRACMEKQDWNLQIQPGQDVIEESHEARLQELWRLERGTLPPSDRIVITHSNLEAKEYNHEVRSACFEELDKLHPGEILLVTNNVHSRESSFMNGELVTVVWVAEGFIRREITLRNKVGTVLQERRVELIFKEVELLNNGDSYPHRRVIFWPYLFNSAKSLTGDEQKALYIDFKIRHPRLKMSDKAFGQLLTSDPFYNCIRAKFGYAMTCHKAQGGEWPHVYLNLKNSHLGTKNEHFFRWAYTAMTRASKSLHILGLPEKEVSLIPQDISVAVTRPRLFDAWELPLTPASRELIAAAIVNALQPNYPALCRPIFHPYLIKIQLTAQSNAQIAEVNYNGQFQISKVKCADSQVATLLAPLVNKTLRLDDGSASLNAVGVVLPNSARTPLKRDVFHAALQERLEGTGVNAVLVQKHPYQDDYLFTWGTREAKIAFYFKATGQNSSQTFHPTADSGLVHLVMRALDIPLL
jgi:hypothetical protein